VSVSAELIAIEAGVGSSVTIEELSAPQPGKKGRILILRGGALPFMGAEWGFENELVTEWYPGNGVEATQQMLGPKEMPSSWEGMWRRTQLGRNPAEFVDQDGIQQFIVQPMELSDTLEDIARRGARLRVTWAVRGRSVAGDPGTNGQFYDQDMQKVREGRVKSFKTPVDRHTDVKWHIEFHWVSRGGTSDKVASVRQDKTILESGAALSSRLVAQKNAYDATVRSLNANVRKSAGSFSLGRFEQFSEAVKAAAGAYLASAQQVSDDFDSAVDALDNTVSQPIAVTSTVLGLASNTIELSKSFINRDGRRPLELTTTKSEVASLARSFRYFATFSSEVAGAMNDALNIKSQTGTAVARGSNQAERSGTQNGGRTGDLIAVHICKEGDTPHTVSMQYFNAPDFGQAILQANRLPWHEPTLRRGQILIIPSLTNTSTQQRT